MPGFTRGSYKAKAIMKRRGGVQLQSSVRERGGNKENKIDGREETISHHWQLWIMVNEEVCNKSVMSSPFDTWI